MGSVITKLLSSAIDEADRAMSSMMKVRARVSSPAAVAKVVSQTSPPAHPTVFRALSPERNWQVKGTIEAGVDGKAHGARMAEQLFGARGDSMHIGSSRTTSSVIDGAVR